MPAPVADPAARSLLRHTVATLAYRGAKALRDAPDGFGDFRASETSRTPSQILAHLGDLMDWALSQARGKQAWSDSTPGTWQADSERFFKSLHALDDYLAFDEPLGSAPERIFQGAIADALTHVGQVNFLRRVYGSPVRGENYQRADIAVGRVGSEQAAPRSEFD
jgi:hypothetical protein